MDPGRCSLDRLRPFPFFLILSPAAPNTHSAPTYPSPPANSLSPLWTHSLSTLSFSLFFTLPSNLSGPGGFQSASRRDYSPLVLYPITPSSRLATTSGASSQRKSRAHKSIRLPAQTNLRHNNTTSSTIYTLQSFPNRSKSLILPIATLCFSHLPSHAMCAGRLASLPLASSQLLPHRTGSRQATAFSAPVALYSLFSMDLPHLHRVAPRLSAYRVPSQSTHRVARRDRTKPPAPSLPDKRHLPELPLSHLHPHLAHHHVAPKSAAATPSKTKTAMRK